MPPAPSDRHAALRSAEAKAFHLLDEAIARDLVKPGVSERQVNDEVRALAKELFGIDTYWHKRIVRSGPNTLCPYADDPADRALDADDIVFFDFGPVFAEWEADVGLTVVLGDDPDKWRIKADVEECWSLGKQHFDTHPDITGAQMFAFVCELAKERGWDYGQEHCGHLIGEFPHEKLVGESRRNYIHPDNTEAMRAPDAEGRPRDWILEVHFVDAAQQIGAFHERLLTAT